MMSVTPIPHNTGHLDGTPRWQHVEPDEFCRLVVSTRPLQRCDNPVAGLRGLEDQLTGELFFVEDVRLTSFLANRRPK